jgi:hypothetical protein
MSADLFAIFGNPDSAPAKHKLEERWVVPQGDFAVTAAPQAYPPKPSNSDVLFDADEAEAEAEDDFGDFEDVETAHNHKVEPTPTQKQVAGLPSVTSISRQVNLLDLGNDLAPVQEHRRLASPEATDGATTMDEADEWGDFEISPQDAQPEPRSWKPSTAVHASIQATVLAPTPNVPFSKDDNWDVFEDWNSEPPPTQDQPLPTNYASTDPPHHPPEIPNEPRPSNIPPPTILLQLLPQVFQSLQSLAQTSPSASSDSLATSIIQVFTVSARLLAGRQLRPKRDTYLSQSVRIGPSTPGSRSGGMKLTSLNKSELLHSEREAATVCDAWSSSTHIFAGIISQSEHRRPWMHLNVNMAVRNGPGYGTLEAREPCVLCGIRREERIAGVDFDADDVFGEYWTEGWGHSDCRAFWYTYRGCLGQR